MTRITTARRIHGLVALGALAVLAVAACGGSQTSVNAVTKAPAIGTGGGMPVPSGAPVMGQKEASSGGDAAAASAGSMPADVAPEPGAGQGPMVVLNGRLTLEVKPNQFDASFDRLSSIIAGYGGFISGTDQQPVLEPDTQRSAMVSYSVPSEHFQAALADLGRVGTRKGIHVSGDDVSLRYVDLKARLKSTTAERDALLALLQRAQTVQEILSVQQQLGTQNAQLEQIEGQIRYFDHAEAMATITINLREAGAVVAPVNPNPLVVAFGDAGRAFTATLAWILVAGGAIGPILIALALVYLAWRNRRRFVPSPRPARIA